MHPSCFSDISPKHFQLGCHHQLWIWIFRGERNAKEVPVVIVLLKLLQCTCPGWGNLTSCHFHTGWRRQYRSSHMCWRRRSYTCGEALWAGKNKHMFYSRLHSITPTGNLTEQRTGSAVIVTTTGGTYGRQCPAGSSGPRAPTGWMSRCRTPPWRSEGGCPGQSHHNTGPAEERRCLWLLQQQGGCQFMILDEMLKSRVFIYIDTLYKTLGFSSEKKKTFIPIQFILMKKRKKIHTWGKCSQTFTVYRLCSEGDL